MTKSELFPMTGGLVVDTQRHLTLHQPAKTLPTPPQLHFALKQHKLVYRPLVKVGDKVKPNQAIAAAFQQNWSTPQYLHTGLSGQVITADMTTIRIATSPDQPQQPEQLPDKTASLETRLGQMGVLGLGGGAFPTQSKIKNPQTLFINGVECEPMLSADACLMTYDANSIFTGLTQLQQFIHFEHIYVFIEADKTLAIESMQKAITSRQNQSNPQLPVQTPVQLKVLPTRYPAGGERQVYEQLFHKRLPPDLKLSDVNILSLNVQTLAAIGAALQGQPLTHRIVTVTGNAVTQPGNYQLPIGTPVDWILDYCKGANTFTQPKEKTLNTTLEIRRGGPLMGEIITNQDAITAGTSALLIQHKQAPPTVLPCIHCGKCEPVCPEQLQPQALIQYTTPPPETQSLADEKLDQLNLDACIGCSICDLVCPSHIPLGATFRAEKYRRKQNQDKMQRAAIARAQYQAKLDRLARPAKPNKPQQPQTSVKTILKPTNKNKLKTNLAKAQRLYREASAALSQAQKKQLDEATLASFQARVNTMQAKAQTAAKLYAASQELP